jgi:hypothetical protein
LQNNPYSYRKAYSRFKRWNEGYAEQAKRETMERLAAAKADTK